MVCRPEVSRDELHPEEGQVAMVTSMIWDEILNDKGQVEDDLTLRKGIFFGGLEPGLRKIVWPFLLHCYSLQSTFDDREQIDAIRRQEYAEIENRRKSMNPKEADRYWRSVVCIVEKDVVRTDRGNPYYSGENNPNIEIMKLVLIIINFFCFIREYNDGNEKIIFCFVFFLIKKKHSFELCRIQCKIGLYARHVGSIVTATGRIERRAGSFLVFCRFDAKIRGSLYTNGHRHGS